jgi:hypothetical protein
MSVGGNRQGFKLLGKRKWQWRWSIMSCLKFEIRMQDVEFLQEVDL